MKIGVVCKSLALLQGFVTLTGLIPLAMAHFDPRANRAGVLPWLAMLGVGAAATGLLWFVGRKATPEEMAIREGFAVTTLVWLIASAIGGTAFWFAVPMCSFIGAWFETMSGFTTTGASIFGHPISIEALDPAVLLWRSMVQWIGGIGIVVFSLTLLPLLVRGGGYQLYRAEVPGITADRLAPRLADTARLLVLYYFGYTAVVTAGLFSCGVSFFDSICHAFTAVSTGGFSTYNDSIEGLESVAAEWWLTLGMLFGGINFGVMLAAILGRRQRLFESAELRAYLGWLTFGICIIIGSLLAAGTYVVDGDLRLHDLVRDSCFQAVSMITTTGYGTGYDLPGSGGGSWSAWPWAAQLMIVMLCVTGACTGSTAGGIKMARLVIALKATKRELRRYLEPNRVCSVQLDGQPVRDQVVLSVFGFILVYFITWAVGTMLLCLMGSDLITSFSAVYSCLSNIGPGMGDVAVHLNFSCLSQPAQFVCIFLMLLGRLEFFAVLLVLWPRNWTR